jgi:hypothetical protein
LAATDEPWADVIEDPTRITYRDVLEALNDDTVCNALRDAFGIHDVSYVDDDMSWAWTSSQAAYIDESIWDREGEDDEWDEEAWQ